ncbi:hypothetical protein NQ317_015547 [Molorchus minor]|uniref:Nose resistant-to-fluoxetine protein N-terminal domain-containing protein n=1 Tax=Molorchus minor TaxID=1323400 RepID=A0ABQ9JP00_9CUCU|nr:hypothetical protein NQ317_015547 [Molorchus minor]
MFDKNILVLGACVLFGAFRSASCQTDASQVMIFPTLPVAVTKSDNAVCKEHSDLYVDNLKNLTLWAHEMWDATAKTSTGVLRGSVYQMGHFEQCLSARAPFLTQYCLASITANVPIPKTRKDFLSLYYDPNDSILDRLYKYKDKSQQPRNVIKVGWCVPASCSVLNLEEYLNNYLNRTENVIRHNNVTYTAQFSELFCQNAVEVQSFDNADISFCLLASLLVLLVITATTYDYLKDNQELEEKPAKKPLSIKLIMAFSARRNFHDLNRADDSNQSLSILYGVRTLSILAIIMDHRFGTFISSALMNFNFVESVGKLTPVYAFVIFYYATLFNHSGYGPLWKVVAGMDSKDCKDNWWANLLYINNYVNSENMLKNDKTKLKTHRIPDADSSKDKRFMLQQTTNKKTARFCMTHAWYLPCDFHYFIFATFLCILIKKERKVGLGTLVVFTIISMAVPFALTIVYQRPALMHFYPDFLTGPKTHPDFQLTYSKTHTRATPYCVGMFAGYVYYKLKGSDKHVNRKKSYAITFFSLVLLFVSVFSGNAFYDPYHKYNTIESASYAAFHRFSWAIGTVALLYILSFGHASFMKKILCWSPWIPLSKLVYGAYLTHMGFQLRSAARFMNPRQLTYFDVISLSLGDMVWAFVAALGLYILIEAPFRKVFRELMFPTREVPPKTVADTLVEENNMINNNNNINCQDSRL